MFHGLMDYINKKWYLYLKNILFVTIKLNFPIYIVYSMYLKNVYNCKCVCLFSLIQYTWDRILKKEMVQEVGFEPRIFKS